MFWAFRLGLQFGCATKMMFWAVRLGLQKGYATKKMFWKKTVVKGITGPTSPPVPGFSLPFENVPNLLTKPATAANVGGSAQAPKIKKPSPPAYCQQRGLTPYQWISMLCPDLNSTVTVSSDIVILSTSLRTSFSSNSVISLPWERMKSCKS